MPDSVEPIPGAVPPEILPNRGQIALQESRSLIELSRKKDELEKQYSALDNRERYSMSNQIGHIREEYSSAQRRFSDKAAEYLQDAIGLNTDEKLEFLTNYTSAASWHDFIPYTESFGKKTPNPDAELRIQKVGALLESIPDQEVNDQRLEALLSMDLRKYGPPKPPSLGEKIISVLQHGEWEMASVVLSRLPISYQAEVIATQEMDIAKPFVDNWIDQLDIKPRGGNGANTPLFDAIATSISHWPAEEQYKVVQGIVTRGDLWSLGWDKDKIPSLIYLTRDWPQELADQFIKIDSLMVKDPTNSHETSCRTDVVSVAMSNWKAEDVDHFLANATPDQLGKMDKDDFKLHLLKFRTAELEESMSEWIGQGVSKFSREALSLLKDRPSFITPDISSEFFHKYNSGGYSSYDARFELHTFLVDYLDGLSPIDKQNYIESLSELFKSRTDSRESLDKLKGDISQWDQEHLQRFAEMLFEGLNPTKESEDYSHKNPQANNAEWVVNHLDEITNPELIRRIIKLQLIDKGDHPVVQAAINKIPDNPEMRAIVRSSAVDCALKYLMEEEFWEVKNIVDKYSLGQLSEFKENLPTFLQSVVNNFDMVTFDDLSEFIRTDNGREYYDFLKLTPDKPALLSREDILLLIKTPLNVVELEAAKQNGINPNELAGEDFSDWKSLFEAVSGSVPEWKDEQSILNPFRNGAEIFGYKQMFAYMNRRVVDSQTHQPTSALALTRHDALHSFQNIIDLYKASGLSPEQFWGNILNQVRSDDRTYDEGNAQQHINAIAATANRNVAGVVSRVQEYRDITRLQELASLFESPQQVFASWNNLKRYSELEQVLEQAEMLDELKELKAQGKEKLYNYIETLAFHPTSKVDMQSVIQFWRDPQSFLGADDSHAPEEVHSRKKPSNYIEIPNLDLTAEELRDSLVEGKMDALQAFSALEISYDVPIGGKVKQVSLRDTMRTALGSRKQGIEGTARSVKKLFNELNAALKPHGLTVQAYLDGAELPEGADPHPFEDLVYNPEFGVIKPHVVSQKFVAKINLKSDPEGVLAGNDTVNCMPFGAGKNTVYTFNPNTAQFLLQIVREDGSSRTIAQSVLTKDMDIGLPIPDVLKKLQHGGHLEDVLPENVVRGAQAYIACDNVEVAPNYGNQYELVIEQIYRDFFKEYVKRFGDSQRLITDKVVIGQGYADALTRLPQASNTYAPQAPVSYSDKTGENVFVLDLSKEIDPSAFVNRSVNVIEPEEPRAELPLTAPGLGYLTFEDALRVAYLEGKAYSDNQSLMQYLHNMENCLIAKDINNAAKDRPNMSLKYTDESGKMRGYFLAYEGVLNDQNVAETSEGYGYSDQPVLYLLDLASDRESPMTGGRLINGFVDLYRKNYLEQGNLMPLFMQAREQTSFRIIQRQLDKISKGLGIEFDLVELPTYTEGDDTMHPIIITPRATAI